LETVRFQAMTREQNARSSANLPTASGVLSVRRPLTRLQSCRESSRSMAAGEASRGRLRGNGRRAAGGDFRSLFPARHEGLRTDPSRFGPALRDFSLFPARDQGLRADPGLPELGPLRGLSLFPARDQGLRADPGLPEFGPLRGLSLFPTRDEGLRADPSRFGAALREFGLLLDLFAPARGD
jgi:hypothetical protein